MFGYKWGAKINISGDISSPGNLLENLLDYDLFYEFVFEKLRHFS